MNRLTSRGLIVLALLLNFACQSQSPSSTTNEAKVEWAYLRIPTTLLTPRFIERTEFNPDHRRNSQFAFGYIPLLKVRSLSESELRNITFLDENLLRHRRFDPRTLQLFGSSEVAEGDRFAGYHNYEQLTETLQTLTAEHPDLVSLESAGKSVQGRELWYARISDQVNVQEQEPKLLYIANMHGDETVGRELMIYLIEMLVKEYQSNKQITQLVNNSELFIMPSMNPDGFESRNRTNANGSDLNRNFPDFTSDNSDNPSGRQPETQAIMELHKKHHFLLALNFHGGALCVNLPWDTKANDNPEERFGDDELMNKISHQYADLNEPMRQVNGDSFVNGVTYGYEWYEVNGGMQDWASYYRGSIHATVELSNEKWPNASSLPIFWQENSKSLINFLAAGIAGAHLALVDSAGNPVNPGSGRITVSSSRRELQYDSQWIHRPTLPGRQAVKLSVPGYQEKTVEVDTADFAGDFSKVVLEAQ